MPDTLEPKTLRDSLIAQVIREVTSEFIAENREVIMKRARAKLKKLAEAADAL